LGITGDHGQGPARRRPRTRAPRQGAPAPAPLGGKPIDGIEGFGLPDDGDAIVARLIELETETIEALQDTIPATGHTGDSEALEHRLEHIIMRKQEAVDALIRARRAD
jgi:hypothetical protein